MGKMRGQTSVEFLYAAVLALLIFTVVTAIYFTSQNDASSLSAMAESRRVCYEYASQIAAVAAAGDGTAAALHTPKVSGNENYTVLISGQNSQIAVQYGNTASNCFFATTNISNGSAQSFYITGQTTVRNVQGGVVLG